MEKQMIKAELEAYKMFEEKFRSEILLVLVSNVEGKTSEYDDYSETSVLSEYYTLDEYELISTTYKKLGYELINYFSEKEFMSAIINNNIHNLHKKIFVINSAQTGTYIGRKSLVPAFCDYFKIMHTGSNPYVVSLCRDKFHSSTILNQYMPTHLETYLYSFTYGWLGGLRPSIGQKIIAKLNGESASIGLSYDNICIYSLDVDQTLKLLSKKYMQDIIVQPFISGYEVELPIIVGKSSFSLIPIGIEIDQQKMLGDKFLDYNSRFYHKYMLYNFDDFNKEISERIKASALKATELLGIEGFGRIDFRISPTNQYYIFDIATNPHITIDSSYAYAFQELGYSYADMLSVFLGLSLYKYFG